MRELGPGLFAIDHPLRMPGGIELGTRCCLIRLASGGVVVHTPGPLLPEVRGALDSLGPVRALIAPNLLHHLSLGANAVAFPHAPVYAAPGLREKLGNVRVDEVLGEEAPALWAADLEQTLVGGAPSLNEVVFFHRASRTLLCLDLCFNVRRSPSLVTRAFMRLNGAYDRFGPSRLFRYAILKDARALRASIDRILAWDFDRVTVAHGEVLESGGRETLRQAFAWLR